MATTANGRTPKLTCPSPTTGATKGHHPRFHATGDEESPHARDPLRRSLAKPNGRSTSCAFPSTNHIYMSTRKERQAYSLLQTTMEPLPHGHWSCSSKPLTRRTGHKLKDASTTGTTGDTTFTGILPLPDKDSSFLR